VPLVSALRRVVEPLWEMVNGTASMGPVTPPVATWSVTLPLLPPPVRPDPALTAVMSPLPPGTACHAAAPEDTVST